LVFILIECRQQFIIDYFEEGFEQRSDTQPCGVCDNCTSQQDAHDFTEDALLLLEATKATGGVHMHSLLVLSSKASHYVTPFFLFL
jgi:superfamily II DNA helicase RecQ